MQGGRVSNGVEKVPGLGMYTSLMTPHARVIVETSENHED